MNNLVEVIKFGGSSLGEASESVKSFNTRVLPIVQKEVSEGRKLVIVISAFLGKTRQLRNQSLDAGNKSNSPEEDAYLSRGEQESSIFLTQMLKNAGFSADRFDISDIPLITNNAHGEANVLYVQKGRIEQKLLGNSIVVVPGFVGRTAYNQVTTLGFDGSDTTAVYLAGVLDCRCTLFKDVVGICTADPRKVLLNRFLAQLNTFDALKLSMLGSGIIHAKALSAAKDFGVEIRIKANFVQTERGTAISEKVTPAEIAGVTFKKMNGQVLISAVGAKVSSGRLCNELSMRGFAVQPAHTALENVDSVMLLEENRLSAALTASHNIYGLDAETPQDNVFGNGKQ